MRNNKEFLGKRSGCGEREAPDLNRDRKPGASRDEKGGEINESITHDNLDFADSWRA